eukprot:9840474-Alexandrium_andersonii.AAC.1
MRWHAGVWWLNTLTHMLGHHAVQSCADLASSIATLLQCFVASGSFLRPASSQRWSRVLRPRHLRTRRQALPAS